MKKSYADMDPLEEIRAIKAEISREFKTVHAYDEYLREKYPVSGAPVGGTSAGRRRKSAKHLVHA